MTDRQTGERTHLARRPASGTRFRGFREQSFLFCTYRSTRSFCLLFCSQVKSVPHSPSDCQETFSLISAVSFAACIIIARNCIEKIVLALIEWMKVDSYRVIRRMPDGEEKKVNLNCKRKQKMSLGFRVRARQPACERQKSHPVRNFLFCDLCADNAQRKQLQLHCR